WARRVGALKWVIHVAPTMVFEVDEQAGTATGRVTVTEQFQRKKGGEESLLGIYHDRYVRRDGTWLFAERRLEVIHRAT
ncbi:MAG TPA: nuclear transport factor 2 family protein, partial [Ilumatobacteraceae bacterium]|nr:nuclear transport factor 2 family protein [Ilumatobacteraceae bacterium]